MAKLQFLATLLFAATVLGLASAAKPDSFVVQGKVYCDNCRAGFETTITEYIEGAVVKLTCKNSTTNEIYQEVEGKTDATGTYNVGVNDDHEAEMCEVALVSSPRKDCAEKKTGREHVSVALADNSGIASNVRYANSLGFLRSEPLELCGKLLAQYALGDNTA